MRSLSATQAVSPAAERTRQFLFHPFEPATYFKLAAVACISEGFTANITYATSNRVASAIGTGTHLRLSDEMVAILALAVVALIAFAIILFYLVSCFRFTFFHCLVFETREIRPVWSRYHPQAIRYFNGGLVVWIVFATISALIVFPFTSGLINLFRSLRSGLVFESSRVYDLFVPLLVIFPILGVLGFITDLVLHDFILPHMALDEATFRNAWRAAREHIAAQKLSFLGYCFLRLALPLIAFFGLAIVIGIPLLILFGVLAMAANGFLEMVNDATPLGIVFHTLFQIVFLVLGLIVALMVEFGLGGPVATWVRNYAILYYGGRYKALGDLLSSSATASAIDGAPETA